MRAIHWLPGGVRRCLATSLTGLLLTSGFAQEEPKVPSKYKLTVVEDASKFRRGQKGRVSSQAVVKVTDENDKPVAGVAVLFSIQQVGTPATFTAGTSTSLVTTNAAGLASSGSFTAASGTSFTINATASVPGGAISAAVPVTTAAVAAAAGISAAAVAGIIVGVAAAAVGAGVAVTRAGGDSGSGPAVPSGPRGTISLGAGGVTFGPPR